MAHKSMFAHVMKHHRNFKAIAAAPHWHMMLWQAFLGSNPSALSPRTVLGQLLPHSAIRKFEGKGLANVEP